MAKIKRQVSRDDSEAANQNRESDENFVDVGRVETEIYQPGADVAAEFADNVAFVEPETSLDQLLRSPSSSKQSEADVSAAWEDGDVGGESPDSGNETPDQNVVDDLGEAVGLVYGDDEPLGTPEKVAARDQHRWELDPASSEGFNERMRREGDYEEK